MESRAETAVQKWKNGYTCSQAVACTYCDLVDMDEAVLFRAMEGFGSGMGNMNGPCGAMAAAAMLNGLKNSTANLSAPDSKAATVAKTKEMTNSFVEQCHGLSCLELKGKDGSPGVCPCNVCITVASQLAENIVFGENDAGI